MPQLVTFNLESREKEIEAIKNAALSNFRYTNCKLNTSWTLVTITGGPGIGKTRLGVEMMHETVKNSLMKEIKRDCGEDKQIEQIYLYIDFNIGCKYCEFIDGVASSSPNISMGTRIAAAAWGNGSVSDISQCAKSFLTERVLEAIVEEKFESIDEKARDKTILMIIIHMDEYQYYVRKLYERFRGEDDPFNKARMYFYEMTKCIRIFMSINMKYRDKLFILPICTGTSLKVINWKITSGSGEWSIVRLFPGEISLNMEVVLRMMHVLDKEKRISDKRMETLVRDIEFYTAFHDTGGIPRYVEILLSEVFKALTAEEESKERHCWSKKLEDDVITRYVSMFNMESGNDKMKIVEWLLQFAASHVAVEENTTILENGKTLTDVEEEGICFLERIGNSNEVYVHIPIVTMRILATKMRNNDKIVPHELIVREGLNPADTFERIIPYLICTRINALCHAGKKCVRTKEVFPGAKGGQDILNMYVGVKEVFVSDEIKKSCDEDGAHLPHEKEGGYLAYVKSEYVNRFVNPFDSVFQCERNNRLFDSKLFLKQYDPCMPKMAVFIQAKHTSQDKEITISANAIKKWYEESLEATKSFRQNEYEVLFVFFTNRSVRDNEELKECEKLLLISAEELEDFNPTFANRCLVSKIAALKGYSEEYEEKKEEVK